jgi:ABC-type glycerol-3-phosphate transport system substrate-binding protein
MGAPDCWAVFKGVVDRGNQDAAWQFIKWLSSSEYYQDNIATKAGRIPTLLTATQKWPDTLRSIDARLTNVSLEVILAQLENGEARGPQLFRYQSVADEILGPAMDQIFVEGSAPVSILQDIAPQVTEAQQQALQRAGGA